MAATVVVVVIVVATVFLLSSPRTLHVIVSNQSFDHPLANLTVLVDGRVAAAGTYLVDDQHNYRDVAVQTVRGHVEVREADMRAQRAHDTWKLGERWVVVQFWGGAPCCDPITVTEFDRPPAFG